MTPDVMTPDVMAVDVLLAVLGATCDEQPATPGEAVHLVRRYQHAFAPTLFSAWLAEGRDLPAGLREECAAARERVAFYRGVAGKLFASVPALTGIKGLEVADAYPAGLVRAMNDLDLVAPGEPELWAATLLLVDEGWEIDTATFSWDGGPLRVMVSLRRPADDPYQLPYGVEVATYFAQGDLGGVPRVVDLPAEWRRPAVKNLLMLLNERFEQRYRARDLVDAALLGAALDATDRGILVEAVDRLRLAPEYAELTRLLRQTELDTLPDGPPQRVARARRAVRGLAFFRRPLAGSARHAQRRVVAGRAGRLDAAVLSLAGRWLPTDRAIRAGLLGFGLPLNGPPPAGRTRLSTVDGTTWADTPAGRFLLTYGDEVTEDDVERATAHRPAVAADPEAADREPASQEEPV